MMTTERSLWLDVVLGVTLAVTGWVWFERVRALL